MTISRCSNCRVTDGGPAKLAAPGQFPHQIDVSDVSPHAERVDRELQNAWSVEVIKIAALALRKLEALAAHLRGLGRERITDAETDELRTRKV